MGTVRSAPQLRRLVAVFVVVLAATLVPPTPATFADEPTEREFVAAINRERAAAGLSALSVAGDLTGVARTHSTRMADRGDLHHNPGLGSDVGGWQKVGEIVGRGPSVSSIHTAFMNSASHERNILDPDWTELGAGVVVVDGQVWVTVVFRLPDGPPPERPSEPEPEPEPEPDPAPAPAPSDPPASPDPGAGPAEAPAPPPEPEPHEVVEQPLPVDRFTVTLARLEAADGERTVEEVLAGA